MDCSLGFCIFFYFSLSLSLLYIETNRFRCTNIERSSSRRKKNSIHEIIWSNWQIQSFGKLPLNCCITARPIHNHVEKRNFFFNCNDNEFSPQFRSILEWVISMIKSVYDSTNYPNVLCVCKMKDDDDDDEGVPNKFTACDTIRAHCENFVGVRFFPLGLRKFVGIFGW